MQTNNVGTINHCGEADVLLGRGTSIQQARCFLCVNVQMASARYDVVVQILRVACCRLDPAGLDFIARPVSHMFDRGCSASLRIERPWLACYKDRVWASVLYFNWSGLGY